MSNHVIIEAITVDRMYGRRFKDLVLTDLSPNINVVYGPNASGKTTLAEAIQTTLLPKHAPAGSVGLEASLNIGTGILEVSVDRSQRECRLNGEKTSWAPELIRPESYHVSLHNLLSAEAGDQAFAEEIVKEASGGYDVLAAGKLLDLEEPSLRKGRRLSRELSERRKNLKKIRGDHQRLSAEKAQMEQLQGQLEQAHTAQRRVTLLEKALAYHDALQRWKDTDQVVQSYPSILRTSVAHTLKNALEQLNKCGKQVNRLDIELADLRKKVSDATQSINKNILPASGLPEAFLEQLRDEIQDLKDSETRIDTHEEKLTGFEEETRMIWTSLADSMSQDKAVRLDFKDIKRLEATTRQLEDVSSRKSALQSLASILKVDNDKDLDQLDERLRQAQRHLSDWLREQQPYLGGLSRIRLILWTAAAVSAAASIITVWTENPLGWAGLVVTLMIGLALVWTQALGKESGRSRIHQSRFQRLDLIEPEAWDSEHVASRLDLLLQEHAKIKVAREKASQWTARASDREEVEAQWMALSERFRATRTEVGLSADAGGSLFYLISKILRWQETAGDAANARAQLQKARDDHGVHLTRINNALEAYGMQGVTRAAEATGAWEHLRTANDQLLRAIEKRDGLQAQFTDLEKQREQARTSIRKLYEDFKLPHEDVEALHRLVQQNEDFQQPKEKERDAKVLRDTRWRELNDADGFSEDLVNAASKQLESERTRVAQLAAEIDLLQEEVTRINTRVQDAEQGRTLEEAHAMCEESLAELAQERDNDCAQAVGSALVNAILVHTREQDLPEVFEKAKMHFLEVTHGRYELRLGRTSSFRAYDSELERVLKLDELSSATRVQLLLCVRVAFVESQESEYCFPLTLDEALGNSDDERAEKLIETISKLAESRQIIYFTAQRDEVNKWERATHAGGMKIITLGEVSDPQPVDAADLPERIAPPPPPPGSMTHEAYGRHVRISPWSAYDPVGKVHLWYLVEDLQLLHKLLCMNLHTWGQVSALLRHGLLDLDKPYKRQLTTLANAVRTWKEAHLKGRGKRVEQEAIEASGKVTPKFIHEVVILAAHYGGDGRALLSALANKEVKGFQSRAREGLRKYLLAEGYITEDRLLTKDEVREAVFEATAPDMAGAQLDIHALDRLFERIRRRGQM